VVEGKKPATWGGNIEAVRPEFLQPKRSPSE